MTSFLPLLFVAKQASHTVFRCPFSSITGCRECSFSDETTLSANLTVFNPRRACARVTVVVLFVCLSVGLSVCLSVCSRSSCFSVRLNQQTTVLTGFS